MSPRLVVGMILALVSAYAIIANWAILYANIRKGKSISYIPFVGGVAGLLAVVVIPSVHWLYGLAPIALDCGTFPLVVWGVDTLRSRRRGGEPPRAE
jgi:hypothetical protein